MWKQLPRPIYVVAIGDTIQGKTDDAQSFDVERGTPGDPATFYVLAEAISRSLDLDPAAKVFRCTRVQSRPGFGGQLEIITHDWEEIMWWE